MTAPLTVGETLPDIALTRPDGETVRATDFAGKKLVLFFYPKDDTPGCTTENKDFSTLAPRFEKSGTVVMGISKDTPQKHQRFIDKHGLANPLATDAAEDGLSDALGIWTEKSMYGRNYMGMERTTVLIDAYGRIARVWNKVKVKGHAAEVLAAAEAL